MSRVNPHHPNAPQTLAAAADWRDRCLIADGSIFTDDSLWTAAHFAELTQHFINNPDLGKDSFEAKLERQIRPASPGAKQLMAEALWLLYLFPSNAGPDAKRRLITSVWTWSGGSLPASHPQLSDAVLGGIGSAGPAYFAHRWREVRFFINLMSDLKAQDTETRRQRLQDPWDFAAWLNAVPDEGERQLKLILPFMLFPDHFERISSPNDVWAILTRAGDMDASTLRSMSKVDRDRALYDLRARLEEDLGEEIDFYSEPASELWAEAPAAPQIQAPAAVQAGRAATRGTVAPLNQILYGPPGTGKTYRAVERAVQILDPDFLNETVTRSQVKARFDAFVAAGQVRFVTFHQSFSYEDFVEGLRAETLDGQIRYFVADGVFKQMCLSKSREDARFAPGRVFSRNYVVLRSTPEILWLRKPNGSELPLPWSILDALRDFVRSGQITVEDIRDRTVFEKVTDTQLEKYIVQGYSNVLPEVVAAILEEPSPASAGRKVLIIDEINRGNVSKIFGELITLLETSKRAGRPEALSVTLPYSKAVFEVPDDLHLIGTMNTADRSLASVDVALRRRFVFEEVEPDPNVLRGRRVAGVDLGELLESLNARIEALLDRDHRLGHAYLVDLAPSEEVAGLREVFRLQILPLLQEYFFEDWRRIRLVLNDHLKTDPVDQIVVPAEPVRGLGGEDDLGPQAQRWRINTSALDRAATYLEIVGSGA